LSVDMMEGFSNGMQSSSAVNVRVELDAEEATFAERLRAIMEAKNVSQEQLALLTGVGQPAISNMLKRQCRPQRRTIVRLAQALDVAESELWPVE
ncbi:MAG: helix-turn-helix domain-containing protein, partial [Planctomyces sp.]